MTTQQAEDATLQAEADAIARLKHTVKGLARCSNCDVAFFLTGVRETCPVCGNTAADVYPIEELVEAVDLITEQLAGDHGAGELVQEEEPPSAEAPAAALEGVATAAGAGDPSSAAPPPAPDADSPAGAPADHLDDADPPAQPRRRDRPAPAAAPAPEPEA